MQKARLFIITTLLIILLSLKPVHQTIKALSLWYESLSSITQAFIKTAGPLIAMLVISGITIIILSVKTQKLNSAL